MIKQLLSQEPIVELVNAFSNPYDTVVATARTCYSPRVIYPEDVRKDDRARARRDAIAESIYKAGHHTTIQHATFQFVLDAVSRQFIWSFLHSHPFYNCVAGDTEIPHFHGNGRPWTIRELYLRWHDLKKRRYVQKMHIRSVDEAGNLVPNVIREVAYSGPKPLFKVTTMLGYTIRSTREHRYRRPDGCWSTLGELHVGDRILVNGTRLYKDKAWLEQQYHVSDLTQRQMAIVAQTTPHTIRKWIRHFKLQKPLGSWSRGVDPHNKGRTKADYAPLAKTSQILLARGHRPPPNGPRELNSNWRGRRVKNPRDRAKLWYKAEQCMVCGCTRAERRIERHHINKDIYNNDPENILILCSVCHKAAESPYRKIKRVIADRIIAIEPDGFEDTYDLVVEGPNHNFVANGFIVHNSEQVSQRYVEVSPDRYVIPPLEAEALELYRQTAARQMAAYHRLMELLEPTVAARYRRLFPQRSLDEKRWHGVVKKRAQEVARYVLPVATHAHLYHTISGLTLHRYHRLMEQFDTPLEQRIVITKMVEAVNRFDPEFFKQAEDPIPLEQTPEYEWVTRFHDGWRWGAGTTFIDAFDRRMGGWATSRLIDYKARAVESMAQAVRSVLGVTPEQLDDAAAVELVLNPARNRHFAEALNLTTLGKLTRTMAHPHFTFQKRLSHTADSQDQRHRTTPASRPVLACQFQAERPDYITPSLIADTPAALEEYQATMAVIWSAMRRLLEWNVEIEYVMYLLPNAFPIRFEESGDLLSLHHKWTKRLCYTAQEEIWASCREEVAQVKARWPALGEHMAAPCGLRQAAGIAPFCPEGERFCGVAVWNLPVEAYERIL